MSFCPGPSKVSARAVSKRSDAGLLATQLVIGGRKTVWAQQYDALTLARVDSHEPVALCTLESAAVLNYRMTLPSPKSELIAAIEGKAWRKVGELEGHRLVSAPGAPTV